jgi:nucleotide-binding universal stress UspA family protein
MYHHILISTDGSELAERAVIHGLSLAKSVGAKVTVIIVEEVFNLQPLEEAGRLSTSAYMPSRSRNSPRAR